MLHPYVVLLFHRPPRWFFFYEKKTRSPAKNTNVSPGLRLVLAARIYGIIQPKNGTPTCLSLVDLFRLGISHDAPAIKCGLCLGWARRSSGKSSSFDFARKRTKLQTLLVESGNRERGISKNVPAGLHGCGCRIKSNHFFSAFDPLCNR